MIILIAASQYLPLLKTREDFAHAEMFADTEALGAIEVIIRTCPDMVVLEAAFAASARGAALVDRINRDPNLVSCEVKVIALDGDFAPTLAQPQADSLNDPVLVVVEASADEDGRWQQVPLDPGGTRRAPRFPIADGVEVKVDGVLSALIEMSVIGAHVVSRMPLKPSQRVSVVLDHGRRPIRLGGVVRWASFELPTTGAQYRAGIEFLNADPAMIEVFYSEHRRS